MSLPVPTRSGYTFNGWFLSASGGTQVTTSTVFSANATIYALWTGLTGSPELSPTNPLKAWIRSGLLHISGLTVGKPLSVYNAAGALVYQSIAASVETDISLNVQGVYIIHNGDNTVRVVY